MVKAALAVNSESDYSSFHQYLFSPIEYPPAFPND